MAAVGDVKSAISAAVANNAFVDLQPASTEEWVTHNIWHEGDIALELYDGTNSVPIPTISGAGLEANLQLHCRNALRPRIKNVSGGAQDIGYDGVVTHA